MNKGREDNRVHQLVRDLGCEPAVPPKNHRVDPWEYDRAVANNAMLSKGFSENSGVPSVPSHRNPIRQAGTMFMAFLDLTIRNVYP